MDTDFTQYLSRQWRDHATAAAAVAATLPAGFDLLPPPGSPGDALADFARLAEHVLLGHLGDLPAFDRWAARFEAHPAADERAANAKARARYACELAHERPATPGALPDDQRLPAAVDAALALAARGRLPGAAAILRAIDDERRDAGPETTKAIASATSTLTFHLQQGPRATGAEGLMVDAAIVSRDAWEAAGTWKEIERAEYFIALACVEAGRGADALAHARRCEAICRAHGDDPYELFFAAEATARAGVACGDAAVAREALDAMTRLLAQVPATESRGYCEARLAQCRAMAA
jgi:hypothetical protein